MIAVIYSILVPWRCPWHHDFGTFDWIYNSRLYIALTLKAPWYNQWAAWTSFTGSLGGAWCRHFHEKGKWTG